MSGSLFSQYFHSKKTCLKLDLQFIVDLCSVSKYKRSSSVSVWTWVYDCFTAVCAPIVFRSVNAVVPKWKLYDPEGEIFLLSEWEIGVYIIYHSNCSFTSLMGWLAGHEVIERILCIAISSIFLSAALLIPKRMPGKGWRREEGGLINLIRAYYTFCEVDWVSTVLNRNEWGDTDKWEQANVETHKKWSLSGITLKYGNNHVVSVPNSKKWRHYSRMYFLVSVHTLLDRCSH